MGFLLVFVRVALTVNWACQLLLGKNLCGATNYSTVMDDDDDDGLVAIDCARGFDGERVACDGHTANGCLSVGQMAGRK